ncbi:MAG: MBL fold metallo-hydrolase [Planctomycetaceae bacterium]
MVEPVVEKPQPTPLKIKVVVTQPFAENTLIVHREPGGDCLVVDPGFGPQAIVRAMEELRVTPVAILLTHGHVDHIAGIGHLRERWPELPILIGRGDAPMLTDPALNLSGQFGLPLTAPPATRLLYEGERLQFLGAEFLVREIPGHSPGHVVYIAEGEPPLVLGGDVLFAGSIGRTDFPGGSQPQLVTGIHEKLFVLSEETMVYPGHGPTTTIGREKRSNPYCLSVVGRRS